MFYLRLKEVRIIVSREAPSRESFSQSSDSYEEAGTSFSQMEYEGNDSDSTLICLRWWALSVIV